MSHAATAGWSEGVFELPSFVLENGETLAPATLSYATIGKRSDDGQNAIVLLPTASGVKAAARAHVGAGLAFDPRKHFIVTVDALGGGGSSRPSQGLRDRFPRYSIRDNAKLVHHLVSEHLRLPRIMAAGGASMGAMIALELALIAPGFASSLFLWSPSSRGGAMFAALTRLLESVLALSGGDTIERKEALFAAGLAYFPALVGRGFLENKSPDECERLSRLVGEAFAANWCAHDLISRYRALNTHDVFLRPTGPDADALSRIKSPCLLMPCASDQLLLIEDARAMKARLPASVWRPIRSEAGHWAASQPPGSPEHRQIHAATRSFLRTVAHAPGA